MLELAYLFNLQNFLHASPWQGNDLKMANIMSTLWTNFAIYGYIVSLK